MMSPYTTALRPKKKQSGHKKISTKVAYRTNSTVAVIGLGYVGLPLALLAARKGYTICGVDLSKSKIDLLNSRISPINDHELGQNLLVRL